MKNKAHVRYKLANGENCPGATTITNQLHKPALVPWANRLGLAGIDVTKYVDDKAAIGTLAHRMILDYFLKDKCNTDDYAKNQIDQAENSFLSFLEWEKQHKINVTCVETQLVSEKYKYGGTFDFYGLVDGNLEVIDFKTGGIWPEHWFQVAAYKELLLENRHHPISVRILNIPRTEDESFKEEFKVDISKYLEGFLKLLEFYYINKELK